jgi:phosphinothricin acetyltransferase
MTAADAAGVLAIYGDGIATGAATFETSVPEWTAWDAAHRAACRFVGDDAGRLTGWAALTSVSERCVYRGVAEVSVYVAAASRGQGIGRSLLEALIEASEAEGLWTLQAGIFATNVASLALHRACGFRDVGRRERLGALGGVWHDVWLLERRSVVVGA